MLLDTWDWSLIFVGVGLLGYLGFMLFGFFKYKHRMVVRQVTRDKLYIIYDKVKVIKIEGVDYWQLKKLKDIIPVPPSYAIDITKKGKFFVEAYRNENAEYVYIKDSVDKANFFQSLSTNQRLIWINQIKKAHSKKKAAWQDFAPLIASGMILIVITAILFGFWEDITKPSLQALKINQEREKIELQQLEILRDIKYNIQRPGGVTTGDDPPN